VNPLPLIVTVVPTGPLVGLWRGLFALVKRPASVIHNEAWLATVWNSALGSLEVVDSGISLPLGPPKQRGLLAVLLLRAGEPVSADVLILLDKFQQDGRGAGRKLADN